MPDRFLLPVYIAVVFLTGCDGGGSGGSDIPPGFNLLESACPAQDINALPVTEGYVWECITAEGEEFIAGTLSSLSLASCFFAVSRTDAYCGIEVLGKASFAASHHEFDLENLPPSDQVSCDPEIAFVIEDVECRTVLLP